MSRFERQVSWLPFVAPTAELNSRSVENNTTFDSIWQPKSSFSYLPSLPETPSPTHLDFHSSSQIQIDSIIDQRHLNSFSTPSPPPPAPPSLLSTAASQPVPLMKAPVITRSKLPIRSQEKNSRAISPSPYESSLPSQKRTKSSTNIHQSEPVLPGVSQ